MRVRFVATDVDLANEKLSVVLPFPEQPIALLAWKSLSRSRNGGPENTTAI